MPSKEEWIKQRAQELWKREGRRPESEQECWDKAVQEYEAATSESERGPTNVDPTVGSGSDPTRET